MAVSSDYADKAAVFEGNDSVDRAQGDLSSDPGIDGTRETPYELLRRTVGTSTARLMREHLQESSHHDEDSYVYRQGLVLATHLRLETNASLERKHLQQSLDRAVKEIKEAAQTIHSKSVSHGCGDAVATAWQAFFHRGTILPKTRVRRLVWVGGRWVGQHPLGAALIAVLFGTAVLWTGIYLHEKSRALRWEGYEIARLNTWQENEAAKTEELRAQDRAAAQREITEQVEQRFKAMEPILYRLAEQLQKTARRVQLEDGRTVWEITLTKEAGFLNARVDPKNPAGNLFMYMAEEPDRWDLTKTSPASSSVELKKNDKAKHP